MAKNPTVMTTLLWPRDFPRRLSFYKSSGQVGAQDCLPTHSCEPQGVNLLFLSHVAPPKLAPGSALARLA